MERGKLIVISGPSGVGKSSVIHGMLERHPEMYFSVSATTRNMREGDENGVTYWFKTVDEFKAMIEAGEFLEYANYSGNYYGTPKEPVESRLSRGLDVIMDIDVQGALQVRERSRDAVLIFLAAREFSVIEQRLRGRGDTSEEDMAKRLDKARWEYSQAFQYDYLVFNDTLSRTVDEIDSILTAEKCRTDLRIDELKVEESK